MVEVAGVGTRPAVVVLVVLGGVNPAEATHNLAGVDYSRCMRDSTLEYLRTD